MSSNTPELQRSPPSNNNPTTTRTKKKKKGSLQALIPAKCEGCLQEFPSKNALFRHLRDTYGACLGPKAKEGFQKYLSNRRPDFLVKAFLYGYMPGDSIWCGEDAANMLVDVLDAPKRCCQRSYGHAKRNAECLRQDEGTGALSEVLCARLEPLGAKSMNEWIRSVNNQLPSNIQVFSRLDLTGPQKNFHAEMDVSHRRIECLLPLDFFYVGRDKKQSRQEFFDCLPSFTTRGQPDPKPHNLTPETRAFLFGLKKQMQLLTTKIVQLDTKDEGAVMEKSFHDVKRNRHQIRSKQQTANDGRSSDDETKLDAVDASTTPSKNVLKRKGYHNFTPARTAVLAHDYLAYRRMDRFHHRETMRQRGRPFFNFCVTGDLFLHGQVPRVVGLLLAINRGLIDADIVDCVFDESYPHLVRTSAIPSFCIFAGDASYMRWEGKMEAILTPRRPPSHSRALLYSKGFCGEELMTRIEKWEMQIHSRIAQQWLEAGLDDDGRLTMERKVTTEILEPWAIHARKDLESYRRWKNSQQHVVASSATLPPLSSLEKGIPTLFEKTLHYLREADSSGRWPTTTLKRQIVMVSTAIAGSSSTDVGDGNVASRIHTSFSVARVKAKRNNRNDRSSAYDFVEGQGGASGSFSVGVMPGEQCIQPKGNELFPQLMKAAFELEMALCPDREPSSTIAINRNAQFRPHTDSGAGAGQSTSLIVGLGDYVGGELMVEGEKQDIRYNAIEFDGWKQRHWTLPFRGERFSLVWFTPKGCEGVHGIDLCKWQVDGEEGATK